ncbi:MAG: hypothetical protein BroJett015_08270 [Chloroflexota bacterium]|nr:hypothetical protein [Ardenticatenaceae bacterium]GIK55164.1 MAG: hypothetical protein BroJett015_08270 [Chloroflexota bacterium]
MSRLLLLFLAIATLFLTPVGVFVCGSLVTVKQTAASPTPCDNPSLLKMAETAVTSYLATPFLVKNLAFYIPLMLITVVALAASFYPISFKRKPPTPPPTVCF